RARQAAALNEGFSRTGLPLPAGVSADPVRPPLCPNGGAWVTRVTLHGPAGDRGLFLSVLPWVEPAFTDCTGHPPAGCRVVKLADGTGIRIIETSAFKPTDAVRVPVDAWRPDGVGISVLETGADGPKPAPRILADEALIRLVGGTVPVLPPLDAPAPDIPARLTALLAKEWTLPEGLRPAPVPGATVPPLTFYATKGAYLLAADLVDDAGVGNLYIDLKPRRAAPFTPACDPARCRLLRLPDGRPAALATQTGDTVVQYVLSTFAPSGAELQIISRNKSAHSDRQPGATRDLPPLSETDLIDIASGPGGYW
ncbi:MAG TPA: hypothetical protein VFT95_19465, partial [Micromonosporaceae bacterium]|nr:hypothetical protein [Micromonosporaceae bacterium]